MANIPSWAPYQNEQLFWDHFSRSINSAIGTNGFSVSSLTTDQINSALTTSPSGTIWWNSTANQWWGNKNGTLVSFNTTAV